MLIIDAEKVNLLLANECLSVGELAELSGVDTVTLSRITTDDRQNCQGFRS